MYHRGQQKHKGLRIKQQGITKNLINNYEKCILIDSYRKEGNSLEYLSGDAARTGDFI